MRYDRHRRRARRRYLAFVAWMMNEAGFRTWTVLPDNSILGGERWPDADVSELR